ncbi:MAG: hypothetical protein HY426_01635 [Candidatus Levybacteria bacterium]|nr:hypothetical protein [Candidatus Levybacteria bacterium]
MQTWEIKDLNAFLTTSDIAIGISIIMGEVLSVEAELVGKASEAVEEVSKGLSSEGVEIDTTDSIEAYLHMADVFRKVQNLTVSDSSGTHLKDPSGFNLVDFLVEDIRVELMKPPSERDSFIPKIEDPKILIEGVEMGVRLYKFAYPLTSVSGESGS